MKILMAGNMEKAQPRLRQSPSGGLRGRRDTALVMGKSGKMQTRAAALRWAEKPWSTTWLPVRDALARSAPHRNKIHQILNFSQLGMYTVPQLTLTLKEIVSHEGLQTQFWGQNRPRGQGTLTVLTQARSSPRDCGHPCPCWSRDVGEHRYS